MTTRSAPQRLGAWRTGDHPGQRQFATLFWQEPLLLESGEHFGPITLAYETWGSLNAERSNGILLLHGFSGDSHAAGPAGPGQPTHGWWDGLIGPGLAIDTDRFFVLCPNAFGSCHGSTGPASLAPDGRPYGSRFPTITIRDMVAAEQELARTLGLERWYAVIGGSMGGMRALEWAVSWREKLERLLLMVTCAAATAEQIAVHATQIRAIELDPHFHNGDYALHGPLPVQGLALARSIAEISYMSEWQLSKAFQRRPASDDAGVPAERYAVEAHLEEQSELATRRLDANSYIALTRAMSHHDIGRGRGGIESALGRIQARTRLLSITSDRLFPPRLQQEIAQGIQAGLTFSSIDSAYGHDGFLIEQDKLKEILRQTLG